MPVNEAAGGKSAYHHGDLRKALLDAAEEELAEKGVEGFTLRGCAKRAGVSHAAPAHHFRDANALLSELASEGFTRFSAAMRSRQASVANDPRAALVGAGLGYIDFARANPALFRLMFSSYRTNFDREPLHSSANVAFGILVESITSTIGRNPMDDLAGMQHVAAAWSMAHGLADLLLSNKMPFLAAVAEQDVEAFLAGIITRAVPSDF